MAKSEFGEVCHDSNVCRPTTLGKKPTEVEFLETLRWQHFIFITSVVFIVFLPIASCDLVETPHNEAVMVGNDPVEFKCKSNYGYNLKWYANQKQPDLMLFNGYSICKEAESFCSVENEAPGEFYLNLVAIREAAQTYVCFEPGTGMESSADLIVIDHEAQCGTFTNNSHVIMKCDLEFHGNWAPELEWSYNGTLIIEGVNISIISNKSVSSTLTVPLSTNERNYTCTTRFDIRGKPQWTTSTNIPSYVSKSVVAVEGNPEYSQKHEGHFSASGLSVGLVIGIVAFVIAVAVFIAIIIYLREKERSRRNEDTANGDELLATPA